MSHAKLSPSKAHRWRACPGSVRVEAQYPDERSSPVAIDGTHTHTLLAQVITMAFMPAEAFIGMELTDQDGSFKVDAERAERVQFAIDYILSRGGVVVSEQSLSPTLLGRGDLKGSIDVQILGEDWLEIIDYKDGMSPVTLPNMQLEQYGWCVLSSVTDYTRFKTIRMTIIQPKLRTKGQSGVIFHEMPLAEFLAGKDKLIADAAATDDPNAPLIAGDHCGYCRHKASCPALGGAVAEVVFADLTKVVNGDDQIRKIIENKEMILGLIDGAEKEALRRFEIGQPIAGLKAVRGRGSRDWAVSEEQVLTFLKKAGVPSDDCYTYKLVSPAQAEKLKWVKRDGSSHTLSDKHRTQMQTEFIKKSDGKLQIVSTADDRQAVELSVVSMFGAITADPKLENQNG